jgi:hypothetical protein
MSNYIKTQAKRRRELAKQDKRQAKEQKRAQRKAELRSGTEVETPTLATTAPVAQPAAAGHRPPIGVVAARKPATLAEAVERWKAMKVAKPRRR